jgi:uncharacterized protein
MRSTLLSVGADAGAVAAHSLVTPLIRASEGGHTEVARLLLARGADPNARDATGRTALAAAAEYGDPELVRVLLQAGADPEHKDAEGRTAAASARGPFVRDIQDLLPKVAAPAVEPRRKTARKKAR